MVLTSGVCDTSNNLEPCTGKTVLMGRLLDSCLDLIYLPDLRSFAFFLTRYM